MGSLGHFGIEGFCVSFFVGILGVVVKFYSFSTSSNFKLVYAVHICVIYGVLTRFLM